MATFARTSVYRFLVSYSVYNRYFVLFVRPISAELISAGMGRRRGGGGDKQRWLVKDPAGVIIAVFAVGLMLTCLGTAWRSISLWVGMTSIVGIIMSFWLGALMLLVLWAHYEVMTSNPGIVPPEISAITPDDNAENGQSLQESDGDDCEESNGEQVEEEMLLHDYEDQEDDGSLLIFCDQCAIYRPPR